MESNLPEWVIQATIFSLGCVSVIIAVIKYLRTEGSKLIEKAPETAVAAFTDSKLMRELISALMDNTDVVTREGAKSRRAKQDLRENVAELNESVQTNTDTIINLLKFIKTRDKGRSD